MADDALRTTLAYAKSPRNSKRTTFQDELQAAISARTLRNKGDKWFSYSDDFDDENDNEDDILKELLDSNRKTATPKAGKKKSKINDFKFSDDEDENVKPKRVSFMKTGRKGSPTPAEDSDRSKSEDGRVGKELNGGRSDSSQSVFSGNSHPETGDSPASERSRSRRESNLSPPCDKTDGGQESLMGGEDSSVTLPRDQSITWTSSTGSIFEHEPPKPKPRRVILKAGSNTEEESEAGGESSPRRPPTSSVSIHLSSTDMASSVSSPGRTEASRSSSPQRLTEEDLSVSSKFSRPSCSAGEQLPASLDHSVDGSSSRECGVSDDSAGGYERMYSTSFEEYQKDSKDGQSSVSESCGKTRPSSATIQRPSKTRQSRPHTAESRYLGTLRVLDLKATMKESQANDADTLRASVYQEWLTNKNAKMKESLRIKRQDERVKEEKKLQEELAKKQEAKASFEAWKEKKAGYIKAKMKEDQETSERKQREMEEKRETAKQVFEQWKKERDVLLKERIRKQKLKENLLKQKHIEEKEERKSESMSAFSKWSEGKKEIIIEKVNMERRQKMIKEEEEKYEKDEKERMALEMYESWLKRKERQERRERRERRIRAILDDETPPPWSPPNRTVPFGK